MYDKNDYSVKYLTSLHINYIKLKQSEYLNRRRNLVPEQTAMLRRPRYSLMKHKHTFYII